MHRLKKSLVVLMAFVMLFSSVSVSAATYTYKYDGVVYTYHKRKAPVYFNGNEITSTEYPGLVIHNAVMLPYKISLVSHKYGPKMTYTYDKSTKMLTLTYNKKVVKFPIGKDYMYVNNIKKATQTGAIRVKVKKTGGQVVNVLYVPAKALLKEALGLNYQYISATNTVYVNTKASTQKNTASTSTTSSTATSTATSTTASRPSTTSSVNANSVTTTSDTSQKIRATSLKNTSPQQFIKLMTPIVKEDAKKTGILASVTMAQMIQESGWGKSTLAQKANNMFGIKAFVSSTKTVWDKKSIYRTKTGEYNGLGDYYKTSADFRKYTDINQSVEDHSLYLLNAKNGLKKRYAGLTDTRSYVKQIQIIKAGEYATDPNYVAQLVNLIQKYNLTSLDR